MRMMDCIDTLAFAKALHVSMEYLISGEQHAERSEEEEDAVELYGTLKKEDPELLKWLEGRYLGKKGSSSSKVGTTA